MSLSDSFALTGNKSIHCLQDYIQMPLACHLSLPKQLKCIPSFIINPLLFLEK